MGWSRKDYRDNQRLPSSVKHLRPDIEWAEFALKRLVICFLLGLLTVDTVFALVMVALFARNGLGLTTFLIGGLLTWTVGRTGTLLLVILK
jgi:hypothetical protein